MYNPNEECQKLLNRIQYLCKMRGWSNYAFAKEALISTSTVHGIMSGKTMPQIYTLLLICNAFKISIEDIFRENFDPEEKASQLQFCDLYQDLSQDEKALIDRYRCLSDKQKKWLWMSLDIL